MSAAFKLLGLFFFCGLFVFSACAQKSTDPIFSTKKGAIKGYDPVAYFTDKKPVQGKEEFSFEWKGATWKFSSQEHLDMFKAEPEKYAPQYGGYCAYGIAKGYAVKIEPDAWDIVDGKLYLNYNKSVQKDWRSDREGYIEKSQKNWPEILNPKK